MQDTTAELLVQELELFKGDSRSLNKPMMLALLAQVGLGQSGLGSCKQGSAPNVQPTVVSSKVPSSGSAQPPEGPPGKAEPGRAKSRLLPNMPKLVIPSATTKFPPEITVTPPTPTLLSPKGGISEETKQKLKVTVGSRLEVWVGAGVTGLMGPGGPGWAGLPLTSAPPGLCSQPSCLPSRPPM